MQRWRDHGKPILFVCLTVFCLADRLYRSIRFPTFDTFIHFYPAHTRMDSLAFGVLIGYWYHFHRDALTSLVSRHRPLLALAAVVLISPCVLFSGKSFGMHTFGFISLYLGFGLVLLLALQVRLSPGNIAARLFAFVGRHSYSIYLWHLPVLLLLIKWGLQRWHGSRLIYFSASLAVGIAMSKLVEFPALMLRDRLFPSVTRQAIPEAEGLRFQLT